MFHFSCIHGLNALEGCLLRVREVFREIPDRPSHHAPTIVELRNKDLLVAWYGGSYEGAEDVDILYSRFPSHGESWTEPRVLVDTPGRPDGNPVFFVDGRGDVWSFYVTMYGEWWDSCKVSYRKSVDEGQSWCSSVVLRDQIGSMIRNKPITLRSGDILLPIYDEKRWCSMVMISEDEGHTWATYGDICTSQGVIQPTVVQLFDGSLLMYMRTGGKGGHIWKSTSTDKGRTWSHASLTSLRNPNSGIDMVRLSSGNICLAFNDTSTGRTPLNVALSTDEGSTWPFKRALETGPGEFSYPAIIQSSDGNIHIVYTNRRGHRQFDARLHIRGANIKHVIINEAWIKAGP